jgi:DNA-binding winged helix-turn-helix (wHTH) protein/TolB-like protein
VSAAETVAAIDLAREAPFRLGALEARPASREVVAGDKREVLEPRVMQVLVALAHRRGEVVSRDELTAACWGGRVVGEDAINRAIAGVRRVGESHGGFTVETIARVGYRLSEKRIARPRASGRWWAVAAGVVLVVLATAGGVWLLRERLAPPPPPAPLRVAVLPFDMIGADPRAQAFADSLLDTMLGVLSSNQVEAVSRTESQALHGPNADTEIARLGVGLLLDGDVESDGKTLKVRVHLDDARQHVVLWSKTLQAPLDAAQALQTQVASRATAVTKFAAWLDVTDFKNQPSVLAEFLESNDDLVAASDIVRALFLARDVVARAPKSSLAHSNLAWAIWLTHYAGGSLGVPPTDARAATAEVAKEGRLAVALDPNNSSAYDVLAAIAPFSAWREREDLLLKSLAAQPSDATARWAYCRLLGQAGRAGDALTQGRLAVSADPVGADPRAFLALALVLAGRPEDAVAAQSEAVRLWGDAPSIAWTGVIVTGWSGQWSRQRTLLDTFGLGSSALWMVADAMASGDAAKKRAAAAALAAAAEAGTVTPPDAVESLSALGDVDGAFREADRLFTPAALRDQAKLGVFGTAALFAPPAAPLRRDPRFMALAAKLGLVDDWRSTGHWPDFCAEPGLPYDCKVEAARLARPHA